MIITAKYGLHHFTGYGENAIQPFCHYKSVGAFCCHDNQTKRDVNIILAILNCLTQATFVPWQSNQEEDHHNFSYFEIPLYKQHSYLIRDKSLQWVWSSCRSKVLMDTGQQVITIAYPEHNSGELKMIQYKSGELATK